MTEEKRRTLWERITRLRGIDFSIGDFDVEDVSELLTDLAAAETRATVAEADCAALREALRIAWEDPASAGWLSTTENAMETVDNSPSPGADLLARMKAMEVLVEHYKQEVALLIHTQSNPDFKEEHKTRNQAAEAVCKAMYAYTDTFSQEDWIPVLAAWNRWKDALDKEAQDERGEVE